MKQIFSYNKYIEWVESDKTSINGKWATYCDGQEVINGVVTG